MCIVSGKEIFDLSNNFSQFCISNFVVEREKPTHTKIRVNLNFVATNLTMLYSYLIGIPWLLILRMIQRSYFLPFTIKLIRSLKRIYHWHHKHVMFHTLKPSRAVSKSWVVGEMYCSFSTDWFIPIYDLFPAPNIHAFIAQLLRMSHQYTRSRVQTLLKSWLFQASLERKVISYRKTRSIDFDKFRQDLANSSLLSDSSDHADLDALVGAFNDTLSHLVDSHAPLKTRTITIRPHSPWYTDEIATEKRKRRSLERRWRSSRLSGDYENYVT